MRCCCCGNEPSLEGAGEAEIASREDSSEGAVEGARSGDEDEAFSAESPEIIVTGVDGETWRKFGRNQ